MTRRNKSLVVTEDEESILISKVTKISHILADLNLDGYMISFCVHKRQKHLVGGTQKRKMQYRQTIQVIIPSGQRFSFGRLNNIIKKHKINNCFV